MMIDWLQPRDETEHFIVEAFNRNFERLREQTGRSLSPSVRDGALRQVLLYYRRLRPLAATVSETEVHLVLPEQRSPKGRRFLLEGIVDIVHDGESTVMYDIKSYLDADAAREHVDPHYRQLNVYAHIWKGLQGEDLDEVALIATRPTRSLNAALRAEEPARIEAALCAWEPVLPIDVNPAIVDEVMRDFGATVDQIEERRFDPPSVDTLLGPSRPRSRTPFVQDVCQSCDGRFGCPAFRGVQPTHTGRRPAEALREALADFGLEAERDAWRDQSPQPRRPTVE